MSIKQIYLFVAVAGLTFAVVANAQTNIIDGITYVPVTPTETITVPPTGPTTAESKYQYSGYILMTVSGYWNPFGTEINPELGCYDCFYFFGNAPGSTNYNLAPDLYFGTSPGATAVVPYDGNISPYTTSHSYTFIANTLASFPSYLYFGVGDSYYPDNTGSLTAQITQLQPVPSAPAFTLQPVSQVVSPGQSVTFTASATGYPTPIYQWQFDGTNIIGATSGSYTIPSTALTNIGYYILLASNSVSVNSSSMATLGFIGINMLAAVYVTGPIGANYQIEATPGIGPTNWTALTNVTITSQPYIYVDYSTPTNSKQFYRAVPQ
jgi:hypothetical protein